MDKRIDKGEFVGLYNVTVHLKDGSTKTHKRVFVDNEQYRLGNIRLTDENNQSVLYPRSEFSKVQYDSKDCLR